MDESIRILRRSAKGFAIVPQAKVAISKNPTDPSTTPRIAAKRKQDETLRFRSMLPRE